MYWDTMKNKRNSVKIHVDFLGVSRLLTHKTEAVFDIHEGATYRELVIRLRDSFPVLVGDVIRPDGELLQKPNMFYIKGIRPIREPEMDHSMADGERIVLMSLSAGG
jgi:hypothetical protein